MRTRFVEATQAVQDGFNHGKFCVAEFETEEWGRACELYRQLDKRDASLLAARGWTRDHALVLDLETGEGALFRLGGSAAADLDKHRVWVCPMFEPFLVWLYEWAGASDEWFEKMPALVELPDAEPAMVGYRRAGPEAA